MPDLDLSRTASVTDADAAGLASPAAFTDLASQIMATPVPAARSRAHWTDAVRASLLAPRPVIADRIAADCEITITMCDHVSLAAPSCQAESGLLPPAGTPGTARSFPPP